jgi:sugar phosphate isomerase/epimerase
VSAWYTICQMSQLAILSDMAAPNFERALDIHRQWNLSWLDLRGQIYGRTVDELSVADARRARAAADAASLSVFCLSTGVFYDDVAGGEQAFHKQLAVLRRILGAAEILEPRMIRVLAAQLAERDSDQGAVGLLQARHPWLVDVYREAIDLITDAGFTAALENEAGDCFLSASSDFVAFFEWLERPKARLTWDINNQWATGYLPTLTDYEMLQPLIGYYHLKGGRQDDGGTQLKWNCSLEDSTYAVAEITQRVVDDGASPVICLNPSQHGAQQPGYDYGGLTERDLAFLRATIRGLA